MIPKPGYKTTELVATVLYDVAVLIAALTKNLSPHWAALGASAATGLYALSRGLTKLGAFLGASRVVATATPVVSAQQPTVKV